MRVASIFVASSTRCFGVASCFGVKSRHPCRRIISATSSNNKLVLFVLGAKCFHPGPGIMCEAADVEKPLILLLSPNSCLSTIKKKTGRIIILLLVANMHGLVQIQLNVVKVLGTLFL